MTVIGIKKENIRYDLIFCVMPRKILYGFGYVNKQGYLVSCGLSGRSSLFETNRMYNFDVVAKKLNINIADARAITEIINRELKNDRPKRENS
jgi:hypothetical protein